MNYYRIETVKEAMFIAANGYDVHHHGSLIGFYVVDQDRSKTVLITFSIHNLIQFEGVTRDQYDRRDSF